MLESLLESLAEIIAEQSVREHQSTRADQVAHGVKPVGLARVQTPWVLVHVSVDCLGKTLEIVSILVVLVDHKLQTVLLSISVIASI